MFGSIASSLVVWLIILKLLGLLSISWWVVFLPLAIYLGILAVVWAIAFVVALLD